MAKINMFIMFLAIGVAIAGFAIWCVGCLASGAGHGPSWYPKAIDLGLALLLLGIGAFLITVVLRLTIPSSKRAFMPSDDSEEKNT